MSEEDSGNDRADKPHEVVIIGGGFGGLHAALSLKRALVRHLVFGVIVGALYGWWAG